MLDFVVIFTKGGIVLWCKNFSGQNYSECVNDLIRIVILEGRSSDSKYFERSDLAVQYKLDNELELISLIIYQKVVNLPYADKILCDMQTAFKCKFEEKLLSPVLRFRLDFDFDKEFLSMLLSAEKNKSKSAPKQMRSFNESLKSKKTVASMFEESERSSKPKQVNIQSILEHNVERTGELSNEKIMMENRKKMKEKLLGKKCTTEQKRSVISDKAGKKPRIWELEGSTKDAVTLDRSKNQEENVNLQKIESYIVGTMQGSIPDIEVVADDKENDNEVDNHNINKENRKISGILSYFKGVVGAKTLTKLDLQEILDKMRDHLIAKNVATDIAFKLCDSVAESLEGKSIGTFDSIATVIKSALTVSLLRILSPKRRIDVIRDALEAKKNNKPYTIIFCGVNGVGKSTNLAKICFWLVENDFSVLIAACDTFRAGAVEQLRTHTRHLNALHPPQNHNNRTMVQLYEKGYGKDAAGIAMEAIKYASDTNVDIVLVDTAGRMQDNEPLMRSLSKLITVNDPDLVLFVGEALVGNEAVDQLVKFNQSLADYSSNDNPHIIDGIVLTKFDTIDDKVGAAISMTYITGQPIVFVGTGQTYTDLKAINVNAVVNSLMK
ncbi:signal recognition particle receptor subunit alpha homolog [Teleopsis dalmanni]|uniref:signal recognition particle receptor subunit alpha homolog n=1 Tax=Teleopsis dalmanni TaxID=139649 RepID=UPI0018CE1D28|nr:signal recognition particle receptor subunit alpha homolog [Teleopsis dalmanni]